MIQGHKVGTFFTTASSAEKSRNATLESLTRTSSFPLLAAIAIQTVTQSLQSATHGRFSLPASEGRFTPAPALVKCLAFLCKFQRLGYLQRVMRPLCIPPWRPSRGCYSEL